MEKWEKEAKDLKDYKPQHLLFLCVANSARSQMAEGIARSLAPSSVQISSAGSRPSSVNPLAIKALSEIGIDISSHHSKSVEEMNAGDIDAVITLCAEEVCPIFLGKAIRYHWGMKDPAGIKGNDLEQLAAFREVREELNKRLTFLFKGWK